jgi:D-lactate dehydrogenase
MMDTARGAICKTEDLIEGLKDIGSPGMDVYEHEKGLFFENHSCEIMIDDLFVLSICAYYSAPGFSYP